MGGRRHVMSEVMRTTCADESLHEKRIVFDGAADTPWIESMNPVMDDDKIQTLINDERITTPEQVSLPFEMDDQSVTSPATGTRCSMAYEATAQPARERRQDAGRQEGGRQQGARAERGDLAG